MHFISASCAGERCRCGKPATHKVGEEIPTDEPCPTCGQAEAIADNRLCLDFYHLSSGPTRHNLTVYVCCECFTFLLGPATGCPDTLGSIPAPVSWREGVNASIERVKWLQSKHRDLEDATYFAALEDLLVHLQTMLERGAV